MREQHSTQDRDEKGRLKKGVILNPRGRPSNAESLAGFVRELLECDRHESIVYRTNEDGTITKSVTRLEVGPNSDCKRAIIIKQMENAIMHGDIKAAEFLFNRAYGKPKEMLEVVNHATEEECTQYRNQLLASLEAKILDTKINN